MQAADALNSASSRSVRVQYSTSVRGDGSARMRQGLGIEECTVGIHKTLYADEVKRLWSAAGYSCTKRILRW